MSNSNLNLPLVMNIIANILNPQCDSEFYKCDSFRRKDAFLTFMNNSKDWLWEHEPRVLEIIYDEWEYLDQQNIPITKDILRVYNDTIQEKVNISLNNYE